jgi:hypothetical protein
MPENEFLIQLLSYTPRDLATVTVTHTAIGCLSVIHCPSMGLEARYLPLGTPGRVWDVSIPTP